MQILIVVLMLVGLVLLNELFRSSKWLTIAFFSGVTVVLTIFVWSRPGAQEGTSIDDWFHWAKLYSVIIALLGFTYMRFSNKKLTKFWKIFPALILSVNILEAVVDDMGNYFELGGIWHVLNALAGVFSIIALSGWTAIYIDKKKKKDMLWLDLGIFWIITYDIWNLAYIYFCNPTHTGYGIAVLLAATIPAIFIKKGTWIQARAYTLSIWMMLLFTFPRQLENPENYIEFSQNATLLTVIGAISFLANLALVIWHFNKISKTKGYKLGAAVHTSKPA
jgi:hypothetical protein